MSNDPNMRCETSVGNTRNGSVLILLGRCNGPGARLLLAPERVGEEGREGWRDGGDERAGVPGIDVFGRLSILG